MDHLKVLKDLIAIDTSVPPGRNYGQAIDYLEPLFRDFDFQTERVVIPPQYAGGQEGRVNLIAHRPAPGKKRLIFYAHIDVVPAEGWPAFHPRIEDGKVYGRGAADMKGSLVALLLALEGLKNRPLKYDLSVMVTTDEEYGQADQLQYLRPYLGRVCGAAFLNLDSSFGYVSIAGLGALHLDIRVAGRSVHSAMSHLGENAVENAGRLMAALMQLKEKVTSRKSAVPVHPGTGLARMQARLNINMVHGGLKVNIVPDECVVSIDRRLIPEENIDAARKEIEATLAAVPDVRWEVVREVAIPTVPPGDDPLADRLEEAMRAVTGQGGKYGEMGSGDLSHIVKAWGGQAFGTGVIRPENNIHGRDEFVYIRDIEDLAGIIIRCIS